MAADERERLESGLTRRWLDLREHLDERSRRLWLAAEARSLGYGGIAFVAAVTQVTTEAIADGMKELSGEKPLADGVRRPGGGRKKAEDNDPALPVALDALVEPVTRGDPMSPLRWTSKSLVKLAGELSAGGHRVSAAVVRRLLGEAGYSLQANAKTIEGAQSPDRDPQFQHIHDLVVAALAAGRPVISVDTKKKELVGPYKNGGREWRPEGEPERVRVHDFIDKQLGKAVPYGVYDVGANAGWVSVGTDHDTAAFAVNTIRSWWDRVGRVSYPGAADLLITADCGGSNGNRVRLWKRELAAFAAETGLTVRLAHLPPGTSKWNRIEHKLFSFISMNWRGRPLTSHEVIVNTISATTTISGLTVTAELDTAPYPKGIKVSDREMRDLETTRITRHAFRPDWNYTIHPATTSKITVEPA
ncbi:ISAzo13 family transposase [Acrocarpospora sp. B8E8]|uniref:ISAzo13 family transposase n=1 Tax=Acrocarpospora sp. B8E8 TaxID=3153572 RepID=UPI00325CC393